MSGSVVGCCGCLGEGELRARCPRQQDEGRRCLKEVIWQATWRLLLRWLPNAWQPLRRACLRLFGAEIDSSAFVDRRARILCPSNLKLGAGVYLAQAVTLDCAAGIEIGEGSRVSQYSYLCCEVCEDSQRTVRVERRGIRLGREVWVAADVYVGGGVVVGDRAVLGARASVFEDVPQGAVVLGSPGRVVGQRREAEKGTDAAMTAKVRVEEAERR